MDKRVIGKTQIPRRHVTEGTSHAPRHVYACVMELTREYIHRPHPGTMSGWNEAAPSNAGLMCQAQAVKQTAASAAGIPREFRTATVTGRRVNENLRKVVSNPNEAGIKLASKPAVTDSAAGFQKSRELAEAREKVAGMPEAELIFGGHALRFNGGEEHFAAAKRRCSIAGSGFALRHEGPHGGPGPCDKRKHLKSKKDWKLRKTYFGSGALTKSALVHAAVAVAVTSPDSSSEINVYADV